MIQRSWFYRNGLFYTILVLVIFLHIIFMALKIYSDLRVVDSQVPKTLNLKIVSDLRANLKSKSFNLNILRKTIDQSIKLSE